MRSKALVVLSGGQDSTTCLFWAREKFQEIHAITFDYNQRHSLEIQAASRVASLAGVASHEVVTLGPILKGKSPLTNPDEKLETYDSFQQMETVIGHRVELTFVPARNPLFLTLAANRAACLGIYNVVTGVCEADNANYSDCTRQFITRMELALASALGQPDFTIHVPLIYLSKSQSIFLAESLPGCMEAIAYSHTCYAGEYPPCGKCHACVLREQGFRMAGRNDPLIERAKVDDPLSRVPL